MTVFLASLAGLPPMAGFVAKFQLFHGLLLNAFGGMIPNVPPPLLLLLPAIVLIFALIGAAAYFKVIIAIWSQPGPVTREPEPLPVLLGWALSLGALAIIVLAIFPKRLFEG